jgi:hypothetical protein
VLTITAATIPVERSEPEEPAIPAAHIARIRAWLRYGMTAAQVGEIYGVSADEVEHVTRP